MSRSGSSTSVKSPPQIKNKGDEMPPAMPSATTTQVDKKEAVEADIPHIGTLEENSKKELDDGNASSVPIKFSSSNHGPYLFLARLSGRYTFIII